MDIRAHLAYSHTGCDVTSPATADQHLSKFEKAAENAPSMALGRVLVALRFACPTVWWTSCSILYLCFCRTTVLCANAFLETFQRLADMALGTRGWLLLRHL